MQRAQSLVTSTGCSSDDNCNMDFALLRCCDSSEAAKCFCFVEGRCWLISEAYKGEEEPAAEIISGFLIDPPHEVAEYTIRGSGYGASGAVSTIMLYNSVLCVVHGAQNLW